MSGLNKITLALVAVLIFIVGLALSVDNKKEIKYEKQEMVLVEVKILDTRLNNILVEYPNGTRGCEFNNRGSVYGKEGDKVKIWKVKGIETDKLLLDKIN